MKKQNPVAKELRTSKFRKRVVEDKREKKMQIYKDHLLRDFLKEYSPKGKVT